MTEELKPHQIAQLVNKLRDIATKYHAHGCLRELISREVNAALTLRPAAQTEREAFEAWFDDYYDKACAEFGGIDCTDPKGIAEEAWQARASLPTTQQATPEPVGEAPIWNSIQIASWIGSQLMHEPAMFERAAVCKFVRALGRHPTLLKHSPKDHVPAPGVPEGWTDADADAARLAMELECLLLDTKDTAAVSRWWKSANEALDLHRARLAAAQAKGGDK